jgi:hypothetical protein
MARFIPLHSVCTAQLVWELCTVGMRTIGIPWCWNGATLNFSITKFNIWVILTVWRMLRKCHSLLWSTSYNEIRPVNAIKTTGETGRTITFTNLGTRRRSEWSASRPGPNIQQEPAQPPQPVRALLETGQISWPCLERNQNSPVVQPVITTLSYPGIGLNCLMKNN